MCRKPDIFDNLSLSAHVADGRDQVRVRTRDHGRVVPIFDSVNDEIDGDLDIDALLTNFMVVHDASALDMKSFRFKTRKKLLLPLDHRLTSFCMIVIADDADVVCLRDERSAAKKEGDQCRIVEADAFRHSRFFQTLIEIPAIDIHGDAIGRRHILAV